MKGTKRFISLSLAFLLISCVFQLLTIKTSYSAVPTITSVTPNTGTISSSTRVTITGDNFEPGAKVSLLSGGPFLASSMSGRYVSVSGNYAYIADGRSSLKVLDISILPSPEIVASIDIGFAAKVYISGDYAYVTGAGLRVVDISDPTSPKLAASVNIPGSIEDLSGNYAYLITRSVMTEKSWLTVVDISNPISPKIASSYDIPGKVYSVDVSGGYAYLTHTIPNDYSGSAVLMVVDISDPTAPLAVGSYNTPGIAFDVYVSGNYAYVAAGQAGLQIIDISDPTSPIFAGSFVTLGSTIKNISVSGVEDNITGSVDGVYLVGNYIYLVGQPGLLVIDVSDPMSPTLVGSHDIQSVASFNTYGYYGYYAPIFNVYVANNYAYVSDTEELLMIDVSNPVTTAVSGRIQTLGEAVSVHVSGDYAYVNALSSEEIHVFLDLSAINIVEPKNMEITSELSDSFFISYIAGPNYSDLYVADNYLYQPFDSPPELRIIDISDPASPILTGSFVFEIAPDTFSQYTVGNVYVSGSYAYVSLIKGAWEGPYSAWLWIIDISDPKAPTKTSSIRVPNKLRGTHGVYVAGNFAYLASGESGLLVVDVKDPAAPFIVSRYDTSSSVQDVYVSDSYAYLADGDAGLSVIDVSDPTSPFIVGSYDTPGAAKRLHLVGNDVYLADGKAGLTVINVSDPTSPFLADSIDTPQITNDVYASDGYAYLANGASGFIVTATHDSVSDIKVVNSTTITATFPAYLPKGSYHILITNPGGQTEEAYLYNAFKADLLTAPETKHKCSMKHHHRKNNELYQGRP